MKDDFIYIGHMLEEINKIELSIKGVYKKDFLKDKLLQDATIRRVEVIGEATKNVSSKLRKKYPDVPWKKMTGTRDKLIHGYFIVDLDKIWGIVKMELSKLRKNLEKILKDKDLK